MATIRDRDFRTVSTSRNLRNVYRHPSALERIDIWPRKDGGAQVGFAWVDGATCITDYASAEVARQFLGRMCKRRGAPAPVVHSQPGA